MHLCSRNFMVFLGPLLLLAGFARIDEASPLPHTPSVVEDDLGLPPLVDGVRHVLVLLPHRVHQHWAERSVLLRRLQKGGGKVPEVSSTSDEEMATERAILSQIPIVGDIQRIRQIAELLVTVGEQVLPVLANATVYEVQSRANRVKLINELKDGEVFEDGKKNVAFE